MNSPGVRKQRVRTSVVALFVGAIPVLIGLLVVALPQYRDLIINTILIYSIAFNVVLFCFYIILSSKRSEVREKESRKYSKILSSIGSIFRARTGLSNTLFDILNGSADSEDYKYMSREFLYYSLNLMKEIAEVYTNDVCSVSIKIIYVDLNEDLEPGVPIVSTYLRDSTSTISRRQTDKTLERYKLSEHKPFSVLTTAGSNGFYFSNNLANDEKKGKYFRGTRARSVTFSQYRRVYNGRLRQIHSRRKEKVNKSDDESQR